MKKNIIIFTTGSSGSSVLTGLIASQGYWLGEKTKELNFDTYENSELVDLNIKILKEAGFNRRDCNDIPPPSVESIKELQKKLNLNIFKDFIKKCNKNGPWLWKDPRLSFTIHFWKIFEDVRKAVPIFIDRNSKQSYSGLILSRKVPMSSKEHKRMNENYYKSYSLFLKENGLNDFRLIFEDIIMRPEETINRINTRLETDIKFKALKQVYKGKFFKKRYSNLDYFTANIYYYLYKYYKKEHIVFPRKNKIYLTNKNRS